ncbi:hypothetical protein XBKQ1_1990023 [Xenorhabdus bovienii str. kraussei Quebec]|uniref:Uncharacterized protein n=1 Tax=Xenorhabdus bovienii str. kraussei Quebec TaxID=1398203 RepID=A0A077PDN7_XENBV|nr:hypothetical protein XBKQ1_1990023 [Xenorhabdus bovienii str. kraussei Quebec]
MILLIGMAVYCVKMLHWDTANISLFNEVAAINLVELSNDWI